MQSGTEWAWPLPSLTDTTSGDAWWVSGVGPNQVATSLRLLADKLVQLEIVDRISHETVRQTLKKTN